MNESLEDSIQRRNWGSVKELLLQEHAENRAAVGLTTNSSLTPLQTAALYAPACASQMLDAGVPPDVHASAVLQLPISSYPSASFAEYAEGYTPLGMAVYRGAKETVEELLRRGDDVNRPQHRAGFYVWETDALNSGHARWIPIHIASLHGYLESSSEIIKILHHHGANLNASNVYGGQAIHLATTHGWTENVKTLLALGADIEAKTAAIDEEIHQLTGTPVDVPRPNRDVTPLMIAIQEGFLELTRFLLDNGANVNSRADQGFTPLHLAAHPWWGENLPIMRLLLAAGADLQIKNERGDSPLDLALRAGYHATAELLRT